MLLSPQTPQLTCARATSHDRLRVAAMGGYVPAGRLLLGFMPNRKRSGPQRLTATS